MKKLLKWVGIILGVIVLCIAGFAMYVQFSGIPSYPIQQVTLQVESTPEKVARGRKLAQMLCVACHFDPQTKQLSGKHMAELPKEFGIAYSRNITQHKTLGIGAWTDGEITFALRTGIHPKTGSFIPPWMPKFNHMADYDLQSIISFLRSDDPLVQPNEAVNRISEPSFLAKFLTRVGVFKPFDLPSAPIPMPDSTNEVALGKYCVFNLDCYQCHSADFKTMNMNEPEKSGGYLGGGNEVTDAAGKIVPTRNITMDKTNGIGNWTKEQFITAMLTGFKPDGKIMRAPMGSRKQLSVREAGAIYEYLKTVPVLTTANKPAAEYPPASNAGQKAYQKYECIRCHGETGGGFGDLTLAYKKYPDDETLKDVILNIEKYYPDASMPVWNGHISDEDLNALCGYVRELGKKAANTTAAK